MFDCFWLSVPVQLIAWKDSSRNDLLCVDWDVKPYTLTHSPPLTTAVWCVVLKVRGLASQLADNATRRAVRQPAAPRRATAAPPARTTNDRGRLSTATSWPCCDESLTPADTSPKSVVRGWQPNSDFTSRRSKSCFRTSVPS